MLLEGYEADLYAKMKDRAVYEDLFSALVFLVHNTKLRLLQLDIASKNCSDTKRFCRMNGYLYRAMSFLYDDNNPPEKAKHARRVAKKYLTSLTLKDYLRSHLI